MGSISSILSSANSLTSAPLATSSGSSTSSTSGTGSSSSNNGVTDYFAGDSTYSQQFQQVIGRAVAIASLPIQLLTSQQTALNSQASELTTLDTAFASIQSAIQNLSDTLGGSGMNSTVSNPAVASVSLGSGAAQGAYSLSVSNMGTYASSLTGSSWNSATQSGGGPASYNLVVGGITYNFTPADGSASTVASTINSQFGNLVQATAVNIGSAALPNYRISLQSTSLGPMDLEIQVPANANLQTAQAAASGYASSLTASTWDSSGNPCTYTLVVDGAEFTISPTDNSAAGVAAAINALSGSPVQAAVVNLGTDASPDLRLQLQSTGAGIATVDLLDASGSSLQAQQTPVAAGSAVSQTAWTWDPSPDPSGNPAEYTLTLGGVAQTFTPEDDTAASVAAAINSLPGSPVTATVVDVGSAGNPDYRLQLTDNTSSGNSPQLTRSTSFNLQNQGPAGSLAEYQVDNSGVTVTSASRQISLAAGTTVTISGTGSTNIVVTQSASALNTALSGFVNAYNSAAAELARNYGQAGGPLQGQSVVYNLSHVLSQISTYYSSASGSIGMSDLGLTLNLDGTLTYNPLVMMGTDLGNSAGVMAFLGSAKTGGFLQAATNALKSVETTGTGLLKTAQSNLQSQITALGARITRKQTALAQLQTNLVNQIARADAAIASMQQQYNYLSAVFQAQQTSNQMLANGY